MPASPTIEYAKTAQDKTLGAITQSQAAVLDVVDSWAKALEGTVQDLPAIPVASSLPGLEELVALQFDFAGKILANQRDFAEKLVRASAPAIKTTPVEVPTPAKA